MNDNVYIFYDLLHFCFRCNIVIYCCTILIKSKRCFVWFCFIFPIYTKQFKLIWLAWRGHRRRSFPVSTNDIHVIMLSRFRTAPYQNTRNNNSCQSQNRGVLFQEVFRNRQTPNCVDRKFVLHFNLVTMNWLSGGSSFAARVWNSVAPNLKHFHKISGSIPIEHFSLCNRKRRSISVWFAFHPKLALSAGNCHIRE